MSLIALTIAVVVMSAYALYVWARTNWASFWRTWAIVFMIGAIAGAIAKGPVDAALWGLYALYAGFLVVMVVMMVAGVAALWRSVRRFFSNVSGPRDNIFINHYHDHGTPV